MYYVDMDIYRYNLAVTVYEIVVCIFAGENGDVGSSQPL